MKSILDPSFRYKSSAHTDVRKTFARIRKEQQRKHDEARIEAGAAINVSPIQLRKQEVSR